RINNRAIDTAVFDAVMEDAFVGYRQSGFGVRVDTPDNIAISIGEIGDLAIRRKADRIGDRDAGKQLFLLAFAIPPDRPSIGFGFFTHRADPERSRWMHARIIGAGDFILGFKWMMKGQSPI